MGNALSNFKNPRKIDISDLVSLVLVPRDESQSEFGNHIPLNDRILIKTWYPAVQEFNDGGKLKISAIETSCGAHPQVNILDGIHPLPVMRETNEALSKDVPARILVRGPFGVGLDALSDEDLYIVLKQIAKASGALDGRKVIFKLFEAQNNPKEHEATIKILKLLKQEGLNVECEGAISYTAEPEYSVEEYQEKVGNFVANDNKSFLDTSSVVKTVSLKDMIGGLDSKFRNKDVGDHANAEILVNSFIDEIEKQGKGPDYLSIAIHCHETGYATEANIAAAIAAVKRGYKIKLDVMTGGTGFAQALAVVEGLEAQGYDCGISQEQKDTLTKMASRIETLVDVYGEYKLDPTQISMKDRRDSHIPGGAVPTTISRHIKPLIRDLKLSEEEATQKIVFFMRKAWEELGHPHSVTPGADNLGATAKQMALNEAAGKEGAALYDGLSEDLLNYWRGEMPHKPDSKVLEAICTQYLQKILPQVLPEEVFKTIGQQILENPTNKQAAKELLLPHYLTAQEQAVLEDQEVQAWLDELADHEFYLKIPDEFREGDEGEKEQKRLKHRDAIAILKGNLHKKFSENDLDYDEVADKNSKLEQMIDHVGIRTLPISTHVPSRLTQIKKDIEVHKRNGLIITEDEEADLIFEALIMRGNAEGGIDENLVRGLYCFKTADQIRDERLALLADTNKAMHILAGPDHSLWS